MIIAIKVTPETINLVEDLHVGFQRIIPQEMRETLLESPTFFLYDDVDGGNSQFLSEAAYRENFQRTNLTMFFPVVREI